MRRHGHHGLRGISRLHTRSRRTRYANRGYGARGLHRSRGYYPRMGYYGYGGGISILPIILFVLILLMIGSGNWLFVVILIAIFFYFRKNDRKNKTKRNRLRNQQQTYPNQSQIYQNQQASQPIRTNYAKVTATTSPAPSKKAKVKSSKKDFYQRPTPKYCKVCGAALLPDSQFCMECGTKI